MQLLSRPNRFFGLFIAQIQHSDQSHSTITVGPTHSMEREAQNKDKYR